MIRLDNSRKPPEASRRFIELVGTAALYIQATWVSFACAGSYSTPTNDVELLDQQIASQNTINCQRESADGTIMVTLNEGDSLLDISCNDIGQNGHAGPYSLDLSMAIDSDVELDEYIVYWVGEGQSRWRDHARVPIRPDGETHTYSLPLHADKPIKAVRISFGRAPHKVRISSVKLRQLRAEPVASTESGSHSVDVRQGDLTVRAQMPEARLTIEDGATNRVWHAEPYNSLLTPLRIETLSESAFRIDLYDCFNEQTIGMTVTAEPSGIVRFSISPEDASLPMSGARFLPPRITSDMRQGRIVFCDRSCGVLLEQTDETYASWPLRVYGNTNCLDMPWVGLFDKEQADGVMMLLETPADAEVALVADQQGRHWPEARWLSSLDSLRYPRVVSLHFTRGGRHVALAARYRDHLKRQGRFKTLAEKAKDKPAVERLRGAPSLWGSRYPTKFIRQMRPLGIDRGIVNTVRDPGIVRWLNDQGYLTGRYDSYTDFTQGPTAFQSDDVERAAIVSRPGGRPKHGWKKRSGEQMYWRSSALWAEALASYTPQELAWLPYNSRFIDVAGAAEPMEDFHHQHTFDRRQDLEYRRAMFQQMNSYGLVLGTEHGNDWAVDLVEYFEGTMSGPFWWSSWPAGYLDRPKKEQLTPQYLKFGMGYANRVPLWELVYHDCANTTWYWGDTAGLLYGAAPELSDRKDLFNLLYGTTPLFWTNNTGYRLPDEIHRMLRTFHDTCQFQKQVAFEQMTDHEFLSDDGAVQRTRFANGATAVVNFSDEPREFENSEVLAPRGYSVHSAGFTQSRTIVGGSTQTHIEFPGYLAIATDGERSLRGVRGAGRLTALRADNDTWRLFADPGVEFEVDAYELTGWPVGSGVALYYMDDLGESRRVLQPVDETGVVRFKTAENSWRFALVREKEAEGMQP